MSDIQISTLALGAVYEMGLELAPLTFNFKFFVTIQPKK
jgi:hypothetical protein